MRWCAGGERIEAASRGHRLIDHDGLLGDNVAKDRTDFLRIEGTRRQAWREGVLDRCLLEPGTHGIRQPFKGIDTIFCRGAQRGDGATYRCEHARLVGITKESHWRF